MGKFKIVEIFEENTECWHYNPDIHCPDSFICWKKSTLHNISECLEGQSIHLNVLLPPNNCWSIKFILSIAINVHRDASFQKIVFTCSGFSYRKHLTSPRNTEKS